MTISPIYHIVPKSELQRGLSEDHYVPDRFSLDGFVHCADRLDVVLAVAADYFSDTSEPLLVLQIDPARLSHRVVFEVAAPLAGGGDLHLGMRDQFPHIYGPVDVAAIMGVGFLQRHAETFAWPEQFTCVASFL